MCKIDPLMVKTIRKRFWDKVDKTGNCWIWNGSRNKKGYGQISTTRNGGPIQAHVLSYLMHVGPTDRKLVTHTCDNPWCVNPEHLVLGTAKDNTMDMVRKQRSHWQKGTTGGCCKKQNP